MPDIKTAPYGSWQSPITSELIVPHRHFIFSIPKMLRRYFLYDRKLLSELSRCAWEALKVFFQETVPEEDAVPGAAVAIQSFGDFLGFNPHCHILSTDGCFYGKGMFRVAPSFETKDLEAIFRNKVFKMLLSKGKITQDLVNMLLSWRHSGFNVFCGPRIQPGDGQAMENLARYTCPPLEDYPCLFLSREPALVRPVYLQGLDYALSQIWLLKCTGLVIGLGQGMAYIQDESKVLYQSKDAKKEIVVGGFGARSNKDGC